MSTYYVRKRGTSELALLLILISIIFSQELLDMQYVCFSLIFIKVSDFIVFSFIYFLPQIWSFLIRLNFFSCMLFPVFHCLLSYIKSGIHHNTITNHHKENKTLFFNSICISSIWLLHSAFCAKVTTFNLISKSICAPLSLPDSLRKSPSHYNYVPGSFWLPQYLCKLVSMKSSWQVSCILASFLIHLRCLLQEGGTHSKWQFNFRPIYAYLTPLSIKELHTTVFFSSSKKW